VVTGPGISENFFEELLIDRFPHENIAGSHFDRAHRIFHRSGFRRKDDRDPRMPVLHEFQHLKLRVIEFLTAAHENIVPVHLQFAPGMVEGIDPGQRSVRPFLCPGTEETIFAVKRKKENGAGVCIVWPGFHTNNGGEQSAESGSAAAGTSNMSFHFDEP
jgi:hypothetical protein